jgi:ASCH domain-containing protein
MEDWYSYISNKILPLINTDTFWKNYLSEVLSDKKPSVGIHLGVFVEPYLSYIIDGKKTVESRFGMTKQPPYERVAPNDIVLLKHSGGPVIGLCRISDVWFYQLDKESWSILRRKFSDALCAQDPEFWRQRKHASFATLMQIKSVIQFPPVDFSKADRRGWVVLRHSRIGTNQ